MTQDPITIYALDKPNEPFSDHLVIPAIEKDQSPMQRDIRDPAGMKYLLTTYLTDEEGDGVALIFFRDENEGPFLEEEVALFRLYQPHIKQSTNIHKAFTHNSQLSSLHSAALNALSFGIIVLDENRRIVVCNQCAKSLVDKNTSFSIRSGKIASNHGVRVT